VNNYTFVYRFNHGRYLGLESSVLVSMVLVLVPPRST